MQFSTFVYGALAAAIVVIASPLKEAPQSLDIAGHVVTNHGVTYQMTDLNEIKAFDNKVDNGKYPYPVDYKIEMGFHCIFYRESSRGVGSPIGEFFGPVEGKFDEWIECYKCWATNGNDVAVRAVEDKAMIPCGFTKTADGGVHDLNETTKTSRHTARFTVNGVYYEPVSYHVSAGCTCDFYSIVGERGGNRRLGEYFGPADGTFAPDKAGSYKCWTGA